MRGAINARSCQTFVNLEPLSKMPIWCSLFTVLYYKLYQDSETGRDLRGKAEIIVAKHRNGAVGNVLLSFRGEYARFQNPEEDDISTMSSQQGENGNNGGGVEPSSFVTNDASLPPDNSDFPPLPDPFQPAPGVPDF